MLYTRTKSERHVLVQAERLIADVWFQSLKPSRDSVMTNQAEFCTTEQISHGKLCSDQRERSGTRICVGKVVRSHYFREGIRWWRFLEIFFLELGVFNINLSLLLIEEELRTIPANMYRAPNL